MFEEIIFKKKINYIFRKNKNKKKSSSLINYRNKSFLFNNKDSISKKKKKNDSLILKKLSRNTINNLGNLYLKNENNNTNNKRIHSFFNLTITNRQNNNIFENKIKPYIKNKKISNKNINIYKEKSNLIVKNYFIEKEKVFPWKNPFKDYKEPLFIYEILKFNNEENKQKNIYIKPKNNLETNIDKKYFINLKNNNNINVSNAHSQRINLLLNKAEKESIINNLKEIKKLEKRKLYDIELRDAVEIPSIKAQNIKKLIYKFITKETNIKEIMNNEIFYKTKENRINFIFDGLKLPTIKNKLIKNKIGKNYEWKNINAINTKTLIYLNQLRVIIQKKIDRKKQIKKFRKKETLIIDEKINFNYENPENQIEKLDKEYLYDCQKYFSSKSLSYNNLNISNNILIKKCIFNNTKFIFEKKDNIIT